MAAKRTYELIPLCHQIPLEVVEVDFRPRQRQGLIEIQARAVTSARTGVEMEALVAVSAAGLALYDMAKAIDRAMVIDAVRLVSKEGGRSGDYKRAGRKAMARGVTSRSFFERTMSSTPQKAAYPESSSKKGRDGPVRGMNPWIFSQAIERTEPATLATRRAGRSQGSHRGDLLGVGYYHPATTIAVRMLSFGAQTDFATIIASRIDQALTLRRRVVAADTTCMRLINGDGDGLSGLVVDRYADVLVMQVLDRRDGADAR